ncbi:MAG: hypothetical protein ACRC1G_08425 [Bradyrhizobium sp.]
MAHQRSLDLVADRIQSNLRDAGVIECRSHHIEQPFDVASGMLVLYGTPFGQLELLGWRPKCDRCIDLAYAGEIVREQLHRSLGSIL